MSDIPLGQKHCDNCGNGVATKIRFGTNRWMYKCLKDELLHPQITWCKDWAEHKPQIIKCLNCGEVYELPEQLEAHKDWLLMYACGVCNSNTLSQKVKKEELE